jgi:hypothetical protein
MRRGAFFSWGNITAIPEQVWNTTAPNASGTIQKSSRAPRADLALTDRLAHEWSALKRCRKQ